MESDYFTAACWTGFAKIFNKNEGCFKDLTSSKNRLGLRQKIMQKANHPKYSLNLPFQDFVKKIIMWLHLVLEKVLLFLRLVYSMFYVSN